MMPRPFGRGFSGVSTLARTDAETPVSFHSKHFRAQFNYTGDTRAVGPGQVRSRDTKRPGGNGAGVQRDQDQRSTGPGRRKYGFTSRA